jgi:hypothetical protein
MKRRIGAAEPSTDLCHGPVRFVAELTDLSIDCGFSEDGPKAEQFPAAVERPHKGPRDAWRRPWGLRRMSLPRDNYRKSCATWCSATACTFTESQVHPGGKTHSRQLEANHLSNSISETPRPSLRLVMARGSSPQPEDRQ